MEIEVTQSTCPFCHRPIYIRKDVSVFHENPTCEEFNNKMLDQGAICIAKKVGATVMSPKSRH